MRKIALCCSEFSYKISCFYSSDKVGHAIRREIEEQGKRNKKFLSDQSNSKINDTPEKKSPLRLDSHNSSDKEHQVDFENKTECVSPNVTFIPNTSSPLASTLHFDPHQVNRHQNSFPYPGAGDMVNSIIVSRKMNGTSNNTNTPLMSNAFILEKAETMINLQPTAVEDMVKRNSPCRGVLPNEPIYGQPTTMNVNNNCEKDHVQLNLPVRPIPRDIAGINLSLIHI